MKRRQALVLAIGLLMFLLLAVALMNAMLSGSYNLVAILAVVYVFLLIGMALVAPRTSRWAKATNPTKIYKENEEANPT